MSENVLIIKRISDDRILSYETRAEGIPLPDLDSTNWDSTAYDFVVGVVNYPDEAIWDPTSGELTDAACATLGLDTSYKAKVLKDVAIDIETDLLADVNYIDDLTAVISGSVVTLAKSVLSASARPTQLAITLGSVPAGSIEDQGQDAYNGLPTWDPVTDLANDYLEVQVRKLDADGAPLTGAGDDDHIVIRASAGKIFGDYHDDLVAGVISFYWQPPPGSVQATVQVLPTELYTPGQELRGASETIQLLNYSMP